MGRSIRATPEGIKKLRQAIKRDGWKQDELKDELGLKTRQPLTRLLAGEPIERPTFEELCHLLDLSSAELVAAEADPAPPSLDLRVLVAEARAQLFYPICEQCGTMRVLDMTQPIALTGEQGLYTNVNILEKLNRRRDLSHLLNQIDLDNFDRFGLSQITEARVPGLDAAQRYPKLMLLGKPGAGKTTFLKFLAMQCIEGHFLSDRVPYFVTLKAFAEDEHQPDLLSYLGGDRILPLLEAGRTLILLDGLDEVREEDTSRVIRQIEHLSIHYPNNHFVITCRIAAKEYSFQNFTEIEVADFNPEQVQTFAQNWFRAKNDPNRATLFLQKLKDNQPIAELAISPLLLTLLCLMFEDTTSFPANRAELYKEGLDVLLKKWDGKRRIERDAVYRNLSLKRKEDLLSQIALITFTKKQYFIKQRLLEDYISAFIRNLPDANIDLSALHLDSEAVLKSIEAHHGLLIERAKGLYSFSHLTFHEYFAAREIVESRDRTTLQNLVYHITEPRWREVFLLTAGMMRDASELILLMKEATDQLLAPDPEFQAYLKWVDEKSQSVQAPYKSAAIRAFYFDLDRDLELAFALDQRLNRALSLGSARTCTMMFDRALDRALAFALDYEQDHDLAFALDLNSDLDLHRSRTFAFDLDAELRGKLQGIRNQLPIHALADQHDWGQWWELNGKAWTERLRSIIIQHRNIGHDWQFTKEQLEELRQYYDANKLLVDCLNSDCFIDRTIRETIEDRLLLPIERT